MDCSCSFCCPRRDAKSLTVLDHVLKILDRPYSCIYPNLAELAVYHCLSQYPNPQTSYAAFPMPDRIHWCPFCHVPPYKSQGNLANHIEENHEPQKHHRCLDCGRSWNTKLGRTRHASRTNCSRQHFETTHHSDKKSLYACGICKAVFDDFILRQEHLLNHQQSGKSKADWTNDTMMHGLLTHASVANAWNLFAIQNIPHLTTQNLSWNWSDGRAVNAMEALEYKRFGNDQQLRNILNDVLTTLNAANELVIDVNSDAAFMHEQLEMFNQIPPADHDFGFDWEFN